MTCAAGGKAVAIHAQQYDAGCPDSYGSQFAYAPGSGDSAAK